MIGPLRHERRIPRRLALALGLALSVLGACSGDDTGADGAQGSGADSDVTTPEVRFCDAYLDYLGDRSPSALDTVVAGAAPTPIADQVADLAQVIAEAPETGRVLAASADLDDVARQRCQPEWIAGAQGAGNTAAAAAALVDALRAGDRFGARNIASANAIAVFEPWDVPEEPADVVVVEVGDRLFSLVLGPDALAECQVETGVVIACSVTR